MYHAGLLACHH